MTEEGYFMIKGLSEETKRLAMDAKPVGMTWDEFLREVFTDGVPIDLTEEDVDRIATRTAERTLAGLARPPYWDRPRADGGFERLSERL